MNPSGDGGLADDAAGPANLPAAAVVWQDGWLATARHCQSPNAGPRPADALVDLALIHSISLPPGVYGSDAIEQFFCNQLDWSAHPYFGTIRGLQVSAHFLIRRNGECIQFVSCDQRAWHAGKSSWRGRTDCNDFSIGIELEGLEGGPFEATQYDRLVRLLQRIDSQYPLASVAGHEHVAPGRKQDPGSGFDWHRLGSAITGLDSPAGSLAVSASPETRFGTVPPSIGI